MTKFNISGEVKAVNGAKHRYVLTAGYLLNKAYPHKRGRRPKLSEAQIMMLWSLIRSGADFTQQTAADAFGVCQATISKAIQRVNSNVPIQEQGL